MTEYIVRVFNGEHEETYKFFADRKDAEPLLRLLAKGISGDYMFTGKRVKSLHYEAEKFERELEA